jgi:hypothetical protein
VGDELSLVVKDHRVSLRFFSCAMIERYWMVGDQVGHPRQWEAVLSRAARGEEALLGGVKLQLPMAVI